MAAALAKIRGVGARGPLGLNALQVAACARARKLDARDTPFRDQHGTPVGGCFAEALPDDLVGHPRLVELGAPALAEACGRATRTPLALFLAAPERDRPGADARDDLELVLALSAASGIALDGGRSAVFRRGHVSGALALAAAASALCEQEAVLVGGLDSFFHPDTLAWLDEDGYLAGSEHGEDGVLPAEAAAFLLLVPDHADEAGPLLTAVELALPLDSDASGAALSRALAPLVAASGGRLPWTLTDLSGERHRTEEWADAIVALGLSERAPRHDAVHLMGEIGAATGVSLAAIAVSWWRFGGAPGESAVVSLSSDGAERAGIALRSGAR